MNPKDNLRMLACSKSGAIITKMKKLKAPLKPKRRISAGFGGFNVHRGDRGLKDFPFGVTLTPPQ